MKYRARVQLQYLEALAKELKVEDVYQRKKDFRRIRESFDNYDFQEIKSYEEKTRHDVKAVEMWLRNKLKTCLEPKHLELVHFGLTSQDINNTALPLMIKDAVSEVITIELKENLLTNLESCGERWSAIPMLARTHGQPATPTQLGKEISVFTERLRRQLATLESFTLTGKLGGATGNMNAHYVAYPDTDWHEFAERFLKSLGLRRVFPSTQIDNYDNIAELCQLMIRINTILIDFCRDIWQYISMGYFKLSRDFEQVGSSTMPHKVNPIDFENAEGNLMYANAILEFLARKLPVSRLQRDLTDSTVLRNIGVPFAHSLVAYQNIRRGVDKIAVNGSRIKEDLDNHWVVVTEAIQTLLRREGVPDAYNTVRRFTQNHHVIGRQEVQEFIETLPVDESVKEEMKRVTPHTYVGV